MEGCGVLRWPSGRSAKVEWQDLYLKRTRGPDDRRERLVLAELLEKTGEGDFLRAVAEAVLQLLMETDVEGLIGAGRYERSGERATWRHGYRERTSIPGSARCSCASRSCGRVATSRRFSKLARARRRR